MSHQSPVHTFQDHNNRLMCIIIVTLGVQILIIQFGSVVFKTQPLKLKTGTLTGTHI